jgi:type VI secretion system protein ImpB
MAGSFQNEIPAARINLKLDVGKGDAKKKMELPLKLLVIGDYSQKKRDERIANRERISVNKTNFEQVMESLDLNLCFSVDNKLTSKGDLKVNLKIKDMDSFRPDYIAKNISALSRLLAARNLLKDLRSNIIDNREFRKRLEELLRNRDTMNSLHSELKKIVPGVESDQADDRLIDVKSE